MFLILKDHVLQNTQEIRIDVQWLANSHDPNDIPDFLDAPKCRRPECL